MDFGEVAPAQGRSQPKADEPRVHTLGGEYLKFMYYVYILKSGKNGKLYKGVTNDLKRRLKEHNEGSFYEKSQALGAYILRSIYRKR